MQPTFVALRKFAVVIARVWSDLARAQILYTWALASFLLFSGACSTTMGQRDFGICNKFARVKISRSIACAAEKNLTGNAK